MNSEVFFENKKYIPVKDAASLTSYSKDYISQLCRSGKVESKKIGKAWYVNEESILNYKSTPSDFDFTQNFKSHEIEPVNEPVPSPFFSLKALSVGTAVVVLVAVLGLFRTTLTKVADRVVTTSASYVHEVSQIHVSAVAWKISDDIALAPAALYNSLDTVTRFYAEETLAQYEKVASLTQEISSVSHRELSLLARNPVIYILDKTATVAVSEKHVVDHVALSAPSLVLKVRNNAADFANESFQDIAYAQHVGSSLAPSHIAAGALALVNPVDQVGTAYQAIGGWFTTAFPRVADLIAPFVENKIASSTVAKIARSTRPSAGIAAQTSSSNKTTIVYVDQTHTSSQTTTVSNIAQSSLVSRAELDTRLQELSNSLASKLYSLSTGTGGSVTNIYQQIAQSQRIDQLSGTTISNATISGSSWSGGSISGATISGGSISGTSITADSATLGSTTLTNLAVSNTSTSTFAGGIDLGTGCVALNGHCLSFGGTPGGADSQIQFNSAGAFNASPLFVWNNTASRLGIGTSSPFATLSVVGNGFFSGDVTAANITATGTISVSGLATVGSLSSASSTIGNATSTSFAITGIASSLLKTNANGSVIAAIPGTDYVANTSGDWAGTFGGHSSSYYLNAVNLTNLGTPFYTYFHATTTDALAEGTTNLYFTNTRFDNRFVSDLSATTSLPNITTLAGLSLPATQLTNFGTPFYTYFSATTTDALAQGSTNKYYSNAFVEAYIHASTTIPKTYAANIFTNTNTFNNTVTLGSVAVNSLLSTNSSGAIVATSTPTFGNFYATSTTATSTISTGGLAVGGSQFVVQQNSGNVGIGTNNPTAKLSIISTPGTSVGDLVAIYSSNDTWQSGFSVVNTSSSKTWQFMVGGSTNNVNAVGVGNFGFFNVSTGHFPFVMNGTNDNVLLVKDGGNVGIGSTTPGYKLSVAGSGYFDGGTVMAANLIATSSLTISNLSLGGLAVGSNGLVYSAATTTAGTGITYSGNAFNVNTTQNISRLSNFSSAGFVKSDASGNLSVDTATYQPSGTYITAVGSGYGTTSQTAIAFSTTTITINGQTHGVKVVPSAGALTLTPTISGTLDNTGLTNSTISGIALGQTLANLSAANSTLTFSGSYNGGTAQTIGLNLGNANTWTAVQTFNYSTTTYGSFTTASTTNLVMNGQSFNNLLGTGLTNSSGALTVSNVPLSSLATLPANSVVTTNASGNLIATGTQLTVGNLLATSTTATSTLSGGLSVAGTSGLTVLQSGNVGVGTAAPQTQLHVYNPNSTNTYIKVQSNGSSQEVGININDASGGWLEYMPSGSSDLRFYNGSADKLTLQNSGNLGIGTSSPSAVLDLATVAGQNAFAVGSSTGQYFIINKFGNVGIGTTNPTTKLFVGSTADTGANVVTIANAGASNVPALTSYTASGYREWITGSTGGSGLYVIGLNPASYSNANVLTSAKVVVDGSGNVGIGTTAPGRQLDIYGTSAAARIYGTGVTTGSASLLQFGNDASQYAANIQLNASTNTLSTGGSNAFVFTNALAGPMIFGTSGSERVRIDASGNVGIGTTAPANSTNPSSPGKILDLSGTNPILTLHNSSDALKEVNIYNHTSGLYIDSTGAATASNNAIYFRTNNTNSSNATGLLTDLTILSNGNVGIGSTNPTQLLSVGSSNQFTVTSAGAVNASSNIVSGGYIQSATLDFGSDSNASIRARGNADLTFLTNTSTERMRIMQSTGAVGIGSTTPGYKLSVAGSGYFDGGLVTASSLTATSTLTVGTLNGPLSASNGLVVATTSIGTMYGGTGLTSYASGDILYANANGTLSRLPKSTDGLVLKLNGGLPSWQTDLTSGGGGGGSTAWSTSTNSMIIYPTNTSNVIVLGANSTTTTGNILEVAGNAQFNNSITYLGTAVNSLLSTNASGAIVATSTPTFGNFYATSTIATSTISTGGLAIGGSQFVVQQNSGNVGVGVLNPLEKLHVSGNILIPNNNFYGQYDNGGTERNILSLDSSNNLNLSNNTTGKTYFTNNGSVRMTIQNDGNIGIGTTGPLQKLDVVGSLRLSTGSIYRPDNAGVAANFGNAVNTLYQDSLYIKNQYANQDWMTIVNGNVGIGTTSPSAVLDVATVAGQNAFAVGSSTGQYFIINKFGNVGVGTANPTAQLNVLGGDGTALNIDKIGGSNRLRIFVGDGNGGYAADEAYFGSNNSAFHFRTGANLATESMTILNGGNVGIGSTTPGYKLSVAGSGYFDGGTVIASQFIATSSFSTPSLTLSGTAINSILSTNSSGAIVATSTPTFGTFYATSTTATSTISTGGLAVGGSQFVVQQNSGNVGVGTTAPTHTLEVAATNGVYFNTGATGLVVKNTTDGVGTSAWQNAAGNNIIEMGSWGTGQGLFRVKDGSNNIVAQLDGRGTNTLTVLTGNTGLGTSTPSAILDVATVAGQNAFAVGSSTGQYFIINKFGNVGIGTTSPTAKLEISGGNSDAIIKITDTSNGSYSPRLIFNAGGSTPNITIAHNNINTGDLVFKSGTSNLLEILSNGNLGIGSTTPGYKLSVAGSGYFDGGTVIASQFIATSSFSTPSLTLSGTAINSLLSTNGSGNIVATSTPTFGNFYATSTVATSTISTGGLAIGGSQFVVQQNSGNVGIGTTGPTSPLDVLNGSDFRIKARSSTATAGFAAYGNAAGDNASLDFYTNNTQRAGIYWNGTGGYLSLYEGGSVDKVVLKSGNVGIGTTGPTYKLDVQGGAIRSLGDGSSVSYYIPNGNAIRSGTAGGTNYLDLGTAVFRGGDASDAAARVRVSGGLSVGNSYTGATLADGNVLISGNVGIGTTSPLNKLHISSGNSGDTNVYSWTPLIVENSGSYNGIGLIGGTNQVLAFGDSANPSAGSISYAHDTDTMNFAIANGTPMVTFKSGSVGIGTTTPQTKLQVNGGRLSVTPNSEKYALGLSYNNSQYSTDAFLLGVTDNGGSSGTGLFQLSNTSGAALLNVNAAGSVGIGTTPGYKLHVEESANSRAGYFKNTNASFTDNVLVLDTTKAAANDFKLLSGYSNGQNQFWIDGVGGAYFKGNVGIGTSTPGAKLNIYGSGWQSSSVPSDLLVTGTGAYGSTVSLQSTDTGGRVWDFFSTGHSALVGAGAFAVRDETASNYRLAILSNGDFGVGNAITDSSLSGANLVVKSGGNVGIGTTTPRGKLEILNTVGNGPDTSGSAAFGGARVSYGSMALDFGNQGNANPVYNWIQSRNADNYSQNYALAINPNGGNVGIGTTSPTALLSLGNGSGAAGTTAALGINLGDPSANLYRSAAGIINTDGWLRVTGSNGYYFGNNAYINGSSGGSLNLVTTGTNQNISFFPSGTGNVIVNNGSVGIGSTTPGYKLSVAGSGYFDGGIVTASQFIATSSFSTPSLTLSGTAINSLLSTNASGAIVATSTPTFGNFYATSTVATSTISTGGLAIGGSQFVVQQNSGNVGIGIANPTYPLHVNGNTFINGSIRADNNTNQALYLPYGGVYAAGSVNNYFAGNVGIGTTSPQGKLQVEGNQPIVYINNTNTALGAYTIYQSNGTDLGGIQALGSTHPTLANQFWIKNYNASGPIVLSAGGGATAHVFVKSDGNVGIGSTNPTQLLSVGSSNQFTVTSAGAVNASSNIVSGGYIQSATLDFGSDSNASIRARGNADLTFLTNTSTERMRIMQSTGAVGIGSTTPGYKLSVAGSGYFDGGTVIASQFIATSSFSTPSLTLSGTAINSLLSTNGSGNIVATSTPTFGNFYATSTVATSTISTGGLAIGGSQFVVQQNSGNVGIGQSNPGAKLEVAGSTIIGISNASTPYSLGANILNALSPTAITNSVTGVETALRLTRNGTYGSKYSPSADFNIGSYAAATNAKTQLDIKLGEGATNVPDVTVMSLLSNGNVGIGTTSPMAALDIKPNSAIALRLDQNGTTGRRDFQYYMSGGAANYDTMYLQGQDSVGATTFSNIMTWHAGGNVGIGYDAGLATGKLTVNGNVGIGTSTPVDKLNVYNTGTGTAGMAITRNANTSIGGTLLYTGATTDWLYGERGTSDSNFHLYSYGAAADAITVLNSNGNVGIGTTSPKGLLTTTNSGLTDQHLFEDTAAAAGNHFGGIGFSRGQFNFDTLSDVLATTTRMVIDKNGNVGIGSTTPGYKLSVAGSGYFDGGTVIASQFIATSSFSTPSLTLSGTAINSLLSTNGSGNIVATSTPTFGNFYATSTVATSTISTGGLAIGGSQFVVQQNSGNVGIGTSGPVKKLEVQGDNNGIRISSASNPSGIYTDILTNYNDISTFQINVLGTTILQAGNVGDTLLKSRGNQNVVIAPGGTGNTVINSNVGIGTTSPQALLHISQNTSGFSDYNLQRWDYGPVPANYNLKFIQHVTSGVVSYGFDMVNNATTYANNLVLNQGNVGIGTAAPLAKLDIYNSTAGAYTTGQILRINNNATVGEGTALSFQDQNNAVLGTISSKYDGTDFTMNLGTYSYDPTVTLKHGNVGIGTTTPGAKLDIASLTSAGNSDVMQRWTWATDPVNWGLRFEQQYNNTASPNRIQYNWIMRAGGTSDINVMSFNQGNVGIGTTSPIDKLVVVGQGSGSAVIGAFGTGSGNYTDLSVNGSASASNYNLSSSPTDSTLYINRPTGGNMEFRESNGTAQMFIKSGGNVGIGTASPSYLLHISKLVHGGDVTALIENTGYTAGASTRLLLSTKGTDGNAYLASITNQQGGTTAGNLVFNTVGTDRMIINSSGNVGIGTTTPSALLDVATVAGQNAFAVGSSTGQYFIINKFGNVGVGTASPAAKLNVIGDIMAGYGTTGQKIYPYYVNGTNYNAISSDSTGAMTFITGVTSPSERMRIDNAGNVGIGTTTPRGKLEVLNTVGNGPDTSGSAAFGGARVSYGSMALDLGNQGNANPVYNWIQSRNADNYTQNYTLAINPNGGNVGIGTTSPSRLLSVSDDGTYSAYFSKRVGIGIAAPTATLAVEGTGTTLPFYVHTNTAGNFATNIVNDYVGGIKIGDATADSAVLRAYSGSNTLLIVNSSGNVGIGTTTPSAKLSITDTTTVGDDIAISGSNSVYGAIGSHALNNGGLYIDSRKAGQDLRLRTQGTDRLIIDSNGLVTVGNASTTQISSTGSSYFATAGGNVGIGTSSPQAALEIAGQNIFLNPTGSSNATVQFKNSSVLKGYVGYIGSTGNTYLGEDGSAVQGININSSGNVGIGTNAPGSKIHIDNGSSNAVASQITGSGTYLWENLINSGTGVSYIQLNNNTASNVILGHESTAGGVLFPGSAANAAVFGSAASYPLQLATANAVRLTIDYLGNVGIGTTSPSNKLHVYSTNSADGLSIDGTTNPAIVLRANNIIKGYAPAVVTSAGGFFSDAVAGDMAFRSESNNILFGIGAGHSSTMAINGSNVGIGTTTPRYPLSVFSSSASQLALSAGAGISQIAFRNANGALQIATTSLDGTTVSNTSLLSILNNGNVGIGVTSPTNKFTVSSVSGSGADVYVTNGAGSNSYHGIAVNNSNASVTAWSPMISNNSSVWATSNFTGALFGTNSNHAVGIGTNATVRMMFDTNGNVGIGTTSPSAVLDVATVAGQNAFAVGSSTGQYFLVNKVGNVGIGTAAPGQALDVNGNIQIEYPYGLYFSGLSNRITLPATNQLAIYTSASERVRIDSNGNVGIGTASPNYKLDVNGNVNLSNLYVTNTISAASSGTLYFQGGNVAVTNGGNIGAGVASPQYNLSVAYQGLIGTYIDGTHTSTFTPYDSSGFATFNHYWSGGSGGYRFQENGTSLATILQNGNVGIGTTTPSALLEVSGGNMRVDNGYAMYFGDVANNNGLRMGITAGTNSAYIDQANTTPDARLDFKLGSVAKVTLAPGGNFGIGTTTPGEKLEVAGNTKLNPASGAAKVIFDRNNLDIGTLMSGSTGDNMFLGNLTNDGSIFFQVNNGTNAMMMNSSANVGISTISPNATLNVQGTATIQDIFNVSSSTGANMFSVGWFGGLTQNIASTSALDIQDGSHNRVFTVDTTQSATNAGMDITAGASQTGNLLNLFSSGGTYLSGFTAAGGLFMNISSTSAIQVLNGTATNVFSVDTVNKRIVLATSTTPTLASDGEFVIGDAGSASTNGRIWLKSNGTTFRFQSDNNTADYSEFFYTYATSTSSVLGTVMSADVSTSSPVKGTGLAAPAAKAYDSHIIGVVSTQGTSFNNPDDTRQDDKNFTNVGLLGHIAVRIASTTAAIHVGDYLTSSAVAGHAMKAERSGMMLGKALENYDPATSTSTDPVIMAIVEPGYQVVNNIFVLGDDDAQLASATSTAGTASALSTSTPAAFLINQVGAGNLLQLQSAGADRFLVGNTGAVSILAQATSTDIVLGVKNAGADIFTINAVGQVTLHGHLVVNADTAGTATITAGNNQATVTFADPFVDAPKVVITVNGVPDWNYGVISKTGSGFTIATSKPVAADTTFDWVALAQSVPTASQSSVNLTVLSAPVGSTTGGVVAGVATSTVPASATSTADTSSPVVSIVGNNPATVTVGSTYNDLGATVTDTNADGSVNNNLGLHFSVDGVDMSSVSIDTTATSTHTVVYSAVDGAGNWGYATRTVEVIAQ